MKAPTTSQNKVLLPAGTHLARCFIVADLGTQVNSWQGEEKIQRQVMFTWETPEEKHTWKEEKGEEPFSISSRSLTMSMGNKANLRKLLETWRGKTFTEDEAKEFDIASVLGSVCLLAVEHEERGDKTYVNVISVSKPPKGMTCPPPINKPILFEIDMGVESEAFKALPKWIQEKIRKARELNPVDDHVTEKEPELSSSTAQEAVDGDSGIPF